MTDDPIGYGPPEPRYLPEMPVPGPPTVPPPVTPPPPGTPPPGMVERQGADGWHWYHALIAFFGGLIASQIVVLVIGGIWSARSGKSIDLLQDDSNFIVVASAINELIFIATAFFVARMTGSVSIRDFGFLRAPFGKTLGKMAIVLASYFVMLGLYNALVHLAPDDSPDKLGASGGTGKMLAFGLLVAVLAPIAEEIFFRGMIYRSLKNSAGIWPAAIISGLLFGALHIDSTTSARLLQVIPLAVLGIAFALLYQWSGTLYSTIALHATNNAIAVAAYADKHHSEFGMWLAAILWIGMMIFCALGHKITDPGRGPDSGQFSGTGGGPVEYALPR